MKVGKLTYSWIILSWIVFSYWQHILNERAVIYNHKTHVDYGLLITWSSDNINTFSGGADKASLIFEGFGCYNS